MQRSLCTAWFGLVCLAWVTPPGCNQTPEPPKKAKIAEVAVSQAISQEITDHEDFTGQTEAVRSIEIRARVTGYLDKVHFQDGAEVAQNTLLFEIDPRPYQAEVERAEAMLEQAHARLRRLNADYRRDQMLHAKGNITDEEYDLTVADRADADAAVEAAKASLDLAKLNLGFTRVTAPIAGRMSRTLIDAGNLVKGDDTILTTIVAQDPIYVYFDLDERTLLRLRRSTQASTGGQANLTGSATSIPVLMGLADEEGFPHRGTIDFEENRVDPSTGTLRVRGVFPNPNRLLSPGLFARVRIPIGHPYRAVLIPEQALGTDQGQKFLYVVNDKSEVVYRSVKVGRLHDGWRVINEGLSIDEKVVVSGLQRVRPGAKVKAETTTQPPPRTAVHFYRENTLAHRSAAGSPETSSK